MNIILSGRNINITDSLRNQVYKKVKKLDRYFEPDTDVQVTLTVEKNRHIVEVTVPFNGFVIRAEESTDDMYASIDLVLDKLESQIRKYRTKLQKKLRPGAFKEKQPLYSDKDKIEEVEEIKVVRRKHFTVKPMLVEEAIMQMDLLGHDFFVFTNGDTDEVNVVYRRNDGNYGLIEPDYL